MHTRNLTQKFEISYVIKNKWHLPVHRHTHYEVQFIIRGSGQHNINDQTYNYKKGDFFILAPGDTHFFIFKERTSICIIKFQEGYFDDFLMDVNFRQVLFRFSSPNRKLLLSEANNRYIIKLMELIIIKNKKADAAHNFIIKCALALVLSLVTVDDHFGLNEVKEEKIQTILKFIDCHIKERNLLVISSIANHFHISKNYFNQYFTKSAGTSYKKYFQLYSLNLIAQQIINGSKTISELADDYGYTDQSHLNKSFKAYFGKSPGSFKNTELKKNP